MSSLAFEYLRRGVRSNAISFRQRGRGVQIFGCIARFFNLALCSRQHLPLRLGERFLRARQREHAPVATLTGEYESRRSNYASREMYGVQQRLVGSLSLEW